MSTLWMVAYDISNHKQRKRVHDLLKNHGQRVQYSIFECRLTHKQQQHLQATLKTHIDSTDSIRWYPLCNWCEDSITTQGNGQPTDPNDYYLL